MATASGWFNLSILQIKKRGTIDTGHDESPGEPRGVGRSRQREARERKKKKRGPEMSDSDFSHSTKDAGFQCTLLGSVQCIKGNKVVSVKAKRGKWLTTALELNSKAPN